MTLFIGLFLAFCCGFFIINLISTKFSLTEKIGLSFPIGMAVETIAMAFIDLIGIKFSVASLLSIQIIILLGVCIPVIMKERGNIIKSIGTSTKYSFSGTNLVWLVFVVAIIYLEYMNFYRCIFYPTYDNDGLTAFDTIGYVSAMEHTYKGISLFDKNYITGIHNPGSIITYAPFVQISYAYVYSLGAEMSKIIPALMYLSFLIAFYGITKRNTSKTAAAIATFFIIMTPDMTIFSTHSATNVMHAAFASLSIIYAFSFIKSHEKKDLYISGALLGANMWCRTEGVVFIISAFAVLFIYALRRKEYRSFIIFASLSVFPALFWLIFLNINNMYSENVVITSLFWDTEKIITIIYGFIMLLTDMNYYGWTFVVFSIMLMANTWFMIKKKESLVFLAMFFIALFCYMLILYHIEYKWDSIENVLSYSAKRFMFCFIPLAWYYSCTNHAVKSLFSKLDNLLSLTKKNRR